MAAPCHQCRQLLAELVPGPKLEQGLVQVGLELAERVLAGLGRPELEQMRLAEKLLHCPGWRQLVCPPSLLVLPKSHKQVEK